MIGMKLMHIPSGIVGTVDGESVQPDGSVLVRISDHWLDADAVEGDGGKKRAAG